MLFLQNVNVFILFKILIGLNLRCCYSNCFAGLLVVSSKDEQPLNRFVDLFNSNKLPSLLNDGAMDPKLLKHYLLVHDNQDGSSEKYSGLSQDYLVVMHIHVFLSEV